MSVTATPLRLDTTVCDRCGRCAPSCKPNALRIGPGYIYVDWDRCTGCGKCADACVTGAISLRQGRVPSLAAAGPEGPAHRAVSKTSSHPGPASARKKDAASRAPAHADGGVVWTLAEGALVLVVAFALLVGAQAAAGAIAGASAWAGTATLAYDAALAALLWYLARRHGAGLLSAFRLDAWPDWTSMLLAVGVAAGCWLFSVTYRASVLAFGLRPPVSEGADLTSLFGAGVLGIVLTLAFVAVVGPVLEEALLRGVVLGAVRQRFGPWPAIAVSALAFALLHASLWSLLPLAVLGVGLGWLAVRSRSLWPAIIAHVLYNAVLVAAALYTAVH